MSQKNLTLVYTKDCVDPADFDEIAGYIRAKAPDIQALIVEDLPDLAKVVAAASWPSLTFAPLRLKYFIPLRGRILCGRRIPKLLQLKLMRHVGIPVPDWAPILPGSRFEPSEWGELVVVKPAGSVLSSYARGIELQRADTVQFRSPDSYPEKHPGRYGPMFVQRYIDSGPYPAKIRVLTLFGTPLYAEEIRADDPQIIPDRPTPEALKNIQITVVTGPRSRRFVYDKDVLDLARKLYTAAPFIPLQGCDFVRERASGKLFALEFNPGGNTWHFSSKAGGHHRIGGQRRQEQFGAFELAADILIQETRRRAL